MADSAQKAVIDIKAFFKNFSDRNEYRILFFGNQCYCAAMNIINYFATKAKMQKMKEIFYASAREQIKEQKIIKKERKLVKQKNGQLSLFDDLAF